MKRLWIVPTVLAALVASALPALAEISPADMDEARATIRKVPFFRTHSKYRPL